jgi:uncharacterized repeat protein (TIGR01451 family)
VVATISGSTNTSCFGSADGTATVMGSGGTPGYTYLWSNGQTTAIATGLVAGTYSVTVRDINLCSGQAIVTIIQPDAINIVSFVTNVSCNGEADGAINLNVSGGTSPYTYNWGGGITTQNRTGLLAGTYPVTVTDINSCTSTASVMISQPLELLASTLATNVSCNGANDGQINLSVTGGTSPYAYVWSNAASTEDPTGLAPGTYTVTVTDNLGCTVTASASITQPEVLLVTGLTTDNCPAASNGSIDITASGGTSPYSYDWGGGITSEDRTGLASGSYMVTVTDDQGCTATSSFSLTEMEVDLISVPVSCNFSDGEIYTIIMNGSEPFTFSWTGPNGFTASTMEILGLEEGTYFLTITDGQDCSIATSTTLAAPDCNPPVAVDDEFTSCSAEQISGSVATNDTDPDNTLAELIFLPLQSPSSDQGVIVWDTSYNGDFIFIPTPGFNGTVLMEYSIEDPLGLSDVGLLTIYVSSMTAEVTTANITEIVCTGTGSATVTHTGGFVPHTYLWSDGQTTATATGLVSGSYTVTVTDEKGCTATAVVTINNFCMTVVKTQTGGPTVVSAAGQVITYTLVVTNTGDADVTGIVPTETYPGAGTGTLSPPTESISADGILNVGETWTYTATYTTTQADVDGGIPLVNTISVVSAEVPGPIMDTETTPVNDVPVAVADTIATPENTPVMGNAAANDTISGDGGNMWTLVGTDGGATMEVSQ